ncbi:hypothetical protein BDY24DRAFT_30974 [Mrakia frigida]|uniref:uncharacterized protein n=1 Tax=Mrakia frigida TaxID=29902 RepID=UPI003FCC1D53
MPSSSSTSWLYEDQEDLTATVAPPLRSVVVDVSQVGPRASPLEQLGRLAGTARKGSLEAVPSSSEASSSTLRPQRQLPSTSSPLVFNSFRNSTASETSTYYTSSIYSNSEDNHAYWEGRRPEDDDQSDEDDARTERGTDDRDDLDDDDATTIEDHGGEGAGSSQQQYFESVGLRSEDSRRNSPNFTTSSRISRMLLDSAQDDDDGQDPDASFGSQWSASSAYSLVSSREQVSRQEPSQSNPSYSSSPPPPSSPTLPPPPPPPSLIRNASIGGVSQRRTEVTRPQIEISSVYGDAGNEWDGGGQGQEWNRSRPPFPSEPSRGGPSPSSPGSSNFSRPMKLSGVGASSPLAGGASASRQKGIAGGGGDFVDPPQRSASLRRKGGGGEAPQLSRSPSPPWTPPFEHDRRSVDPVPFPQHPIPSPTPSAAVPSTSFSPRLPSSLRQQSSSSTSSRPQSPPTTSPVSPTSPYGPPRPKFATNTFGSNSSISSISSLPTRRAPPPPVDRPAFNGDVSSSKQSTVRLVPPSNQPSRQAHPSNGATNWRPTLPLSSSSSSPSKFTPQLPSQRKSTYPPSPTLPLQPQNLQPNLSASSQRIRAYSESEQGYDSSTRPGLSPLTGTTSGPPSFAAVPPKPSFTVTSRDRSGSGSGSPLSQQSSSSSLSERERELVGSPVSLRLSPVTSRAEIHPGLFSVCE